MDTTREIFSLVDLFIAPSRFLMKKFLEFGIPKEKMVYSDYGFNMNYFKDIKKKKVDAIRFGYIGTLIPTKGVNVLIRAFNEIEDKKIKLKIFGPYLRDTDRLKAMVKNGNIKFMGGYKNWEVGNVLSDLDVIVVPSIWYENSPLVIHEAFLAKIPVIASNAGGMAELVQHMKNGLLFKIGDPMDLGRKIDLLIKNPEMIRKLGQNAPAVKTIEENANELLDFYRMFMHSRRSPII